MDDTIAAAQLAYHAHTARLGRRRLALRTGLTEMAVRIELERLRDRGFVELARTGVVLTEAGERHFRPLFAAIRSVTRADLSSLRIGDVHLAAHVAADSGDPIWELRDAAIREGTTGLLVLRYAEDGWVFAHDGEPVRQRNPADAETLANEFPQSAEGDMLIIAAASDLRCAGLGLWRVLLRISNT